MECGKCGKSIGECTCSDMDERMAKLRDNDRFIYKMCEKCGKHYARCKCEEPVWISSHKDFPLEKVYNTPTFADIIEMEQKKREGSLN